MQKKKMLDQYCFLHPLGLARLANVQLEVGTKSISIGTRGYQYLS